MIKRFNYIGNRYYEYYLNGGSHIAYLNKFNSVKSYVKSNFKINEAGVSGDRCIAIYLNYVESYTL